MYGMSSSASSPAAAGTLTAPAQQPAPEDGGDLLGDGLPGAAARVEGRRVRRAREQQARRGEHCGRRRRARLDGHRGAGDGPRGQRSRERVEIDGAR